MPVDFAAAGLDRRPFISEGLQLREIDLAADIALLHRWFGLEYAGFWGLQHKTEHEVHALYAALVQSGHAMAYTGLMDGEPAFLVECYDPAHDVLGQHYRVMPGDVGMHFFVGPPRQPRHGHTRRVFRVLMRFIFERLRARRVVVEPDLRNDKVHVLNREMGFAYRGTVQLPDKLAALALCTREGFFQAQREESIP
ncbi:GNAT family N-acetyltransferase [Piscinibacter sp. HJYY11]|uniref:GNAT family N-acetyltransferase n=1 Tax=Piscinibacter sp. HJYY11 TaxID=2801333 RepID=UPI00191F8F95|nr:GNAT family N-acetyltransferase [Piscinibacter sp. HJYY11]MBL0729239.1 acetyltransferase [Piscinibacter sp. HJYY11]